MGLSCNTTHSLWFGVALFMGESSHVLILENIYSVLLLFCHLIGRELDKATWRC